MNADSFQNAAITVFYFILSRSATAVMRGCTPPFATVLQKSCAEVVLGFVSDSESVTPTDLSRRRKVSFTHPLGEYKREM